jgi:hypothetical protein
VRLLPALASADNPARAAKVSPGTVRISAVRVQSCTDVAKLCAAVLQLSICIYVWGLQGFGRLQRGIHGSEDAFSSSGTRHCGLRADVACVLCLAVPCKSVGD